MAITISDVTPRVQYTATSGQTAFSINFEFFVNADIKVYNGSSVLSYAATPANATQYSVTGAGVTGGGSITLGSPGATLNDVITIYRDMSIARATDFPTSGAFQIASLNDELDKIVAMTQQVSRDLKYSPRAASTTASTYNLTFPELSANKILTVNAGGTALEFSHSITNVNTIAGIASDVTTVSGIASNVTSVASNASNINLVAGSIGSVNTVAADISKVIAVANDLAEAVSEIETVADDLNEATSEIDTVAANVANVNTVGGAIANVNLVAGKATEIGLLGTSAVVTDLGLLGTSAVVTDLDLLATSANVTAMGLLGVSAVVTDMGILGTSANVTNMATLGTSTNVTNMASLAGISGLATLASNNADISTVADNIAGVNSFADRYRISSSAPASSLDVGDLYFDTTANELKVYKSSGWAAAGSTVNGTSARYNYTATAAQTTFTGADTAGNTLAYDAGFADVYLNGVRLSAADITITSGTSVVLLAGATVGDILDIVGYGTFNVAAVAGSAINSGTINNARLSSDVTLNAGTQTLTNKTINGSNNTISNVPNSALVGTGAITINGSAVSLGGSVTVGETKPTITSFTPSTIENTATNVVITGQNFVAIPNVEIINSSGVISYPNTITRDSATQITINVTLATDGAYFLRIENPDGNAVRTSSASLIVSDAPTISTGAGSLGSFAKGSAISISLAGTGDATLVWSSTGTLPTGLSLASATGIISGTESSSITAETAYPNIVVTLTDGQSQTTSVTYSITISVGATGGGQFN